jgi:hypothetical protein
MTVFFTRYKFQHVGQNHNIKIANKPCESEAKFQYFVMTRTRKHCLQEEVRAENSGIFSTIRFRIFSLLLICRNVGIKIRGNRNVIFPVIFCGCEYWSYIQRRRYADNV